jgi:uncharacterized protein YhbP (UPF0306 family)
MRTARKQIELVAALLGEETTLSLATTGEDSLACVAPLFYIVDEESLSLLALVQEQPAQPEPGQNASRRRNRLP